MVKIKDKTKIKINIEELSKSNDIKGVFARKLLEKYEKNIIDKETMEKVLEIGLEVL